MNILNKFFIFSITLAFLYSQTNQPWGTIEEEVNPSIDFKDEYLFNLSLGSSVPFGKNLKDQFTSGMNFKLNVLTGTGFA